jgi:hypothetical protein
MQCNTNPDTSAIVDFVFLLGRFCIHFVAVTVSLWPKCDERSSLSLLPYLCAHGGGAAVPGSLAEPGAVAVTAAGAPAQDAVHGDGR